MSVTATRENSLSGTVTPVGRFLAEYLGMFPEIIIRYSVGSVGDSLSR
jgi:hypothetical protein